ncbi:amidotransferase [Citrobacter koseri]|uniref:Amidotransferase n=1 Tax=Citrobacter koseri TaxID=545 RepID=A0A2X2X7W5_CITKO|nr:amidotransferase [Citrobacter koseri]
MCQPIFALVSTGLVQRGGGTGPHKDGWGITFYEGKGCPHV